MQRIATSPAPTTPRASSATRRASCSDEELLRAWCAGDAAAGDALLRRYYAPLRSFFASRVGHDTSTTADLAHQTFMTIVEKRAEIRHVRAYLYRVAQLKLFAHRRRRQWGEALESELPGSDALGPLELDRVRERTRYEDIAAQALRSLSQRDQTLLAMKEVRALEHREIGQRLAIAPVSVGYRLRTARRRLARAAARIETTSSRAWGEVAAMDSLSGWIDALAGELDSVPLER